MWNKQQIRNLKEKAHAFCADDYVQVHLTSLNRHLKNFEILFLIHKKNEKWKDVEREADHIRDRFFQLCEETS